MSSNSLEFSRFVDAAETMENESGKLAKIEHASDLLGIAGADVGIAARFIQGDIFPAWDNRKVSVGSVLVYKALAEASGLTRDEIESRVADVGDPGLVCEQLDIESDSGQVTLGERDGLTVSRVYEVFCELATTEGSGSQQRKIDLINTLLFDASGREAKFIVRLLLGKMRIGVGGGTVRRAISEAFGVDESTVKRGVMVTNDVEVVAMAARDGGSEAVSELSVELGRPIKPMLAQKTSKSEALSDAGVDGEVLVEWKYDGARLQPHVTEDGVRLFTRRMNEVTDSMPDVCAAIEAGVSTSSAVLDCEVVAYKPDSSEPEPFQEVMRRLRRKHDIKETAKDISLQVHVFDVLYADGESVLDLDSRSRRKTLESIVDPSMIAEQWVATSADEIASIEQESLEAGHEGVMVKSPTATYQPDNRGKNWVKIKPDVETLDCVVVGGEWGEGRRAEWVGTFMLAVQDEDESELKRVGKVATGLTDSQLESLTERLKPLIQSENGSKIEFKPELVFEVGCEEIQQSSTYNSGYGLRFPRYICTREDKSIADADTQSRVQRLYANQ